MISRGIPFEAVGVVGNLNHGIWIPVFDRLGPPPPTPIPILQEDLRPGLVESAVEVPPRRAQTPARPRAKAKAPHPDAGGSTGSRKSHGEKRHQENKRKARNQGDQAQKRGEEREDLTQRIRVTHTISGGPTLAGTSNNLRKSYAREIPRLNASVDEFIVSDEPGDPPHSTRIVFSGEDVHDSTQPHDDPMVISIQVANCRVRRVLVDIGSSVDILFKGAHEQLNLKNSYYNSCTSPLYGFTGDSVMPIGSKFLPVVVGEAPLQQNVMTNFIVEDTPSAFNAILGRPFMSGIRGVLSIHHNVLKFPVGARVGEVRGDQQAARHCRAVSTDLATLAERSAQVAAESSQGDSEQDHYILDDGEVPDMVVEDSEEEEQGWASGHPQIS